MIFFLLLSENGFDILCKSSLERVIYMKCQTFFFRFFFIAVHCFALCLTISYQKPFVFSVSVYSQKLV